MANFRDDLSAEQKEYFRKMYGKLYNKKEEIVEENKKEEVIEKWSATKIDTNYKPSVDEFNKLFVEQPLEQVNTEYKPKTLPTKNALLNMYKNVFLIEEQKNEVM